MKKRFFVFFITIISFTFYSCSKTSAILSGANHWTINGSNYTGISTSYDDTSSTNLAFLTSTDVTGNSANITFYNHPSAGTIYDVIDGSIPNNSSCLITIITTKGLFTSTGKSGDKVNLTVSAGKITATFSNITMSDGAATVTGSGTLVQP